MADEMLKEKWAMTFALMDINRDGVLSSKDRDEGKASFQNVLKQEGDQFKSMLANLDTFWDLAVFLLDSPDWSKSINREEFIASRKKAYDADKNAMVGAVRKAVEHLCNAGDVNGTKTFTFEELQKLHKAFNIEHEDFIKCVHSMVAPHASGTCKLESVVDFYTEFILGENAAKHEICKGAFKAAGFNINIIQ